MLPRGHCHKNCYDLSEGQSTAHYINVLVTRGRHFGGTRVSLIIIFLDLVKLTLKGLKMTDEVTKIVLNKIIFYILNICIIENGPVL
jgi:hypothetical protein